MTTVPQGLKKIWSDESFKNRLISNPKSVLADEFGVVMPESIEVEVHENTLSLEHYVIPVPGENLEEVMNLEKVDPVLGQLIRKAWSDKAFKAKLLKEPRSAVAEVTGTELPKSLEIRVYENTPTLKHVVLPIESDYIADENTSSLGLGY